MGLQLSKEVEKEYDEDIQEGSIPSTPILAAKNIGKIDSIIEDYERDPRSPSQFFSRTPIQLLSEKLEELDEDYETDGFTERTPKNFKILGVDPRSPSADFNRTPIVVSASPDQNMPIKLHNKNFDNVLKSTLITPTKPSIIPPKLLESSPITPKSDDAYKRKSFVGLLETNIDFTETDLDAVIREKYHSPKEELDPRSPTSDFVRTPIQLIKKLVGIDINKSSEDVASDNEEVVEKIDHAIEQFPLVKSDSSQEISQEGKKIEVVIQEVEIVEVDEPKRNYCTKADLEEPKDKKIHSAPVSPPAILAATPKKTKSEPTTPPLINITADVKELDKKLTNLIYEDNSVVHPKILKTKEQNRTPLSDKNGTNHKKLSQKLKVSDKPRKSQYAVSKIPVYKEKKGYCENTPPNSMDRKHLKPKKSQWDNDTTLVI